MVALRPFAEALLRHDLQRDVPRLGCLADGPLEIAPHALLQGDLFNGAAGFQRVEHRMAAENEEFVHGHKVRNLDVGCEK